MTKRESQRERRPPACATAVSAVSVSDLLARLRASTRSLPHTEPLPPPPDETLHEVASGANLADLFARAAEAVGCRVWRTGLCGWVEVMRGILYEERARSVLVEAQPGTALTAERAAALAAALTQAGIEVRGTCDDNTLFAVDAAITGVQAAVAETGTVVCTSGASSARGASLIPPTHVACVMEAQLIADLFDLFAHLAAAELPANVNLITGPSKTADIEGVLVTGMHGPGAVHIVLVRDG